MPNNVDYICKHAHGYIRDNWRHREAMYMNANTGNDHCRMDSQWNCSNKVTGLLHTGSGDAAMDANVQVEDDW